MSEGSKSTDVVELGRELTEQEVEQWTEKPGVDWNADENSDISFSAGISTDVSKSEIEDETAKIDVESHNGEVTARIQTGASGSYHAATFLDGSPDDMEALGQQLILAARAARAGETAHARQ